MRFDTNYCNVLVRGFMAGVLAAGMSFADAPAAFANGAENSPPARAKKSSPDAAKKAAIRNEIAEVDDEISSAIHLANVYENRAAKADRRARKTEARAAQINNKRAKNQVQIKKDKATRGDLNRRLRSGKNPDGSKMTLKDKDNIVRKSNALGSKIGKAEAQDKADKKAVGNLRNQAKKDRQEAQIFRGKQGAQEYKVKQLKKERAALRKKLRG